MNPLYANIPEELKARPQWVVWRKVERDGKTTKVPFQPNGRAASTTNSETWNSFTVVCAVAHLFDGIGYVFSVNDPYTGIDFDHCLSGGEVLEWAVGKIGALCPSYAEISPSGKGVKSIVKATLPGPGTRRNGFGGDKAGAVEMYNWGRYFTITGDRWSDSECECIDRQAAVDLLYMEVDAMKDGPRSTWDYVTPGDWRPPTASLTDDEIVAKLTARGIKSLDPDVQTFRTLYHMGDPSVVGGNDSDADFVLCMILAKWVGDDESRIERLFNDSALAEREKWRNRERYRELTIQKAIVRAYARFSGDVPDNHVTNGDDSGVLSVLSFLSRKEEEWEEPIVSPPVEVPPFPLDVFPSSLTDLCYGSSLAMRAPVDFFGAMALGVAGAAAGQATTIALEGSWEEAANLYLAVMGDPGTKKSPALKVMAAPLWTLDREMRSRAKADREDWDRRRKAAERAKRDFAEDEPPRQRLVTDDATKEALGRMLHANHRGMALIKDELTSLVASMNAYRGGKGDDLQFYMKLNTRSFVAVDRVKDQDNPILIMSPCLTILGCMTPGTVSSLVESGRDNGWLDRFIFSYPSTKPHRAGWGSAPKVGDDLKIAWKAAIRHIHGWPHDTSMEGYEPVRVKFDETGYDAWSAFFDAHNAESTAEDFPRSLKGPWSKMEGFCARIALILAMLRWSYVAAERGAIEGRDVEGAVRLIDYFKACFRRVRSELSGYADDADDETADVIRWLRSDSITIFDVRDVLRKFRTLNRRRRDEILAWLTERRFVRPIPVERRKGRPSPAYEVNPLLRDKKDRTDKTRFSP